MEIHDVAEEAEAVQGIILATEEREQTDDLEMVDLRDEEEELVEIVEQMAVMDDPVGTLLVLARELLVVLEDMDIQMVAMLVLRVRATRAQLEETV